MPEIPEMQALAERLDAALAGRPLDRYEPLGFTGLKTASPPADDLVGRTVTGVGRRGKYDVLAFDNGLRVAFHLSQGGRIDLESPPKDTRPRGSVVRWVFGPRAGAGAADGASPEADGDAGGGPLGVLFREHGSQRKAGWWVLGPDDDGPLADLGPDVYDPAFADLVAHGDSNRRLHTWLRDQHVVAGIGRGYSDDALNRAGISPFATLSSLDEAGRQRLVDAVRSVMDEALVAERRRTGGLSDAKLGDRFLVHRRAGQPCPRCGEPLLRVSYESYEMVYCKRCQTGGRVLADRRLSRLLR
ncbi:MAG TPA: DNA-formamidopyrimidine glycosylase family protein [Acidimicrobiales bacterium]|nr:DNA-formamidopyrimidine glycosylase family protein [Acidimicrobiales bacterium]